MTYGVFSPVGRRANDFATSRAAGYPGTERRTGAVRRAGMRARSLLTGKLIVGDGEMSVDCVIRNLSARGARAVLPRGIDLPAKVSLMVVREALLCEATVTWRNGDQTGLAFSARHDLTDPAARVSRGIRALWQALAP